MHLLILTAPEFLPNEAEVLTQLFHHGLYRLHLRKPGCAERQLEQLIQQIPSACYPRISLHDHFPLQARYRLGGIHLNSRNPDVPVGFQGLVSRSCHTLEEAARYAPLTDYYFLSPIFDSISKQGYHAGFTEQQLCGAAEQGIINEKTIALGGVTADKLPYLASLGFGGAAFLGDIWSGYHSREDIPDVMEHFLKLMGRGFR